MSKINSLRQLLLTLDDRICDDFPSEAKSPLEGNRRYAYAMRPIEVARYYLPPRPGSGPRAKPYPSSWKMTAAEAEQHGAVGQVPGTAEVRQMPETDDEQRRTQAFYPSAGRDSVQPPRKG